MFSLPSILLCPFFPPTPITIQQTHYMEQCGMAGKPYRETELTLKNILSKHDTLDGNRLSREGFLSYYREVAATDPRQVTITASDDLLFVRLRTRLSLTQRYRLVPKIRNCFFSNCQLFFSRIFPKRAFSFLCGGRADRTRWPAHFCSPVVDVMSHCRRFWVKNEERRELCP